MGSYFRIKGMLEGGKEVFFNAPSALEPGKKVYLNVALETINKRLPI
jgi:hypothetical protein